MITIELTGINKVYGEGKNSEIKVDALKDINLKFETGIIYAIMGHSGSGKSTLMHILGLLDRPSSGEYYLKGKNVATLHDFQVARIRNKEIGFVFQSFNLLPRYSVYKNLELPLSYSHMGGREKKERIESLLKDIGLDHRMKHLPGELSGGERQRVAIARGLVNNPSILLADEPTGNLDTATEEEVMKLITDLKTPERTIILVTHEMEIAEYADVIIHLKDGEVLL